MIGLEMDFSLNHVGVSNVPSHPSHTGFEILKQMLTDDQVLVHLPLEDIWEWQVGVACRQTGGQRLKAIHLLLRLLKCPSQK